MLLSAVFCAGTAFAADPILGTWKLNVAKSKFGANAALTAATRTYTEASGLCTLDQKLVGADGKEMAYQIKYREGKEEKDNASPYIDTTVAKKIDANTWDFTLKKGCQGGRSRASGSVSRRQDTDGIPARS